MTEEKAGAASQHCSEERGGGRAARQLGVDGAGIPLQYAQHRGQGARPDGVEAGARVRDEQAQDLRTRGAGGVA